MEQLAHTVWAAAFAASSGSTKYLDGVTLPPLAQALVFFFFFFAHDSLVSEVALLGWGWLRWLVVLFGRCSSLGWSGVVEGGRQARHRFVTAGLLGRVSCFEVVPTRDKGVGPASYYLGGQLACRRLSFRPGCEQHQSPGHEYLATRNPQQV